MPSSGKCDFSHIYVVGLIQSILIHFDTVLFDSVHIDYLSLWCSSNVHVLVWSWLIVPRMLVCVVLFLLCVFTVFSQIQGIVLFSVDLCGFPSFVWHLQMTMVWIDHPVVVYTENVYIEGYIHQHLNTILLFVPTLISIYNHTLNLSISQKNVKVGGFVQIS